jgi:hypothetical protein
VSDYDVENLLGEKKPERTARKRPQRSPRPAKSGEPTRPTQRAEWSARNGIYDHLAATFRDTPVYVMQGAPLIAKLLRERVQADRSLTHRIGSDKPRDEHVVQDLVEYMIRRFWATVPNDQRANAFTAFLKDEWWQPLAEEAINHMRLQRIADAPETPGGPAILRTPLYAEYIAARKRHPAGGLRDRLIAARHHHEQESN